MYHVAAIIFVQSIRCVWLKPHGLQHAMLPSPSLFSAVCSNSYPLSQWCLFNHPILSHPLLLLPSIFPRIRVFANESAPQIKCPNYWSFSFSISPLNGYSWLVSFRIDWLGLLPIQRTLESLLQYHSKPPNFWYSAFFLVKLSHSYMTTGKTTPLDLWQQKMVSLLLISCLGLSRRRQWQPTPVLLPGKSHGRRSLVGCSPWGRKESDTTERLPFHFSLSCTGEGNGNPLQCSCLENPRDAGA